MTRARDLQCSSSRSGRRGARKSRRGAMAAMVGVLMVAMVGIAALSIDFGRLDNLKADLQTSADAAALAGAVELIPFVGGHNPANALDTASAYAQANKAMQANVTVVSADCGTYIEALNFYLPSGSFCVPILTNAIEITVSRQSSGLFISALGVSAPNVQATAVAAYLPNLCTPGVNCRATLITRP